MQNDTRMIELLAEMLHEIKGLRDDFQGLRKDFQGLEKEQHSTAERMTNMETEQRRTTNAVWELSQMMQKVVWEPSNKMAEDIGDLKRRVERLENTQK